MSLSWQDLPQNTKDLMDMVLDLQKEGERSRRCSRHGHKGNAPLSLLMVQDTFDKSLLQETIVGFRG